MVSGVSSAALSIADFVSAPASGQPAPRWQDQQNPTEAQTETVEASADQDPRVTSPDGLTSDERQVVAELQQIDRQVRAHEQAHLAAAAGLARGISFTFVTGPDGQQYAVGGEVSIDTSPISGDPEATIRKAQQIRAAANAPADPSGQDRAVAAQASQMEQAARLELAEQIRTEREEQNRASQVEAFQQGSSSSVGSLISLLA